MSKYTTQVRFICENAAGLDESAGYNRVDEIINLAAPSIFTAFPIFDEDYRLPLENKILKHYYTREICEETVGLWKLRLDERMNLIMPYYNKLYESALLHFNPLYDTDLTKEIDRENTGNTTRHKTNDIETDDDVTRTRTNTNTGTVKDAGTANTQTSDTGTTQNNGDLWSLYSDTPQGGIGGIQGAEDDPAVGTNAYLTNATHNISQDSGRTTDTGTSQTNTDNTRTLNTTISDNDKEDRLKTESAVEDERGTSNNVEDYIEKVNGKTGGASYSKMLLEFRQTFLNIDKMIIDDLSDLFFGLWQ